MADNARGIHVSPGVYSREIDLHYAVKSLGLTTLGLAGETLKGPAFEPISIENWAEFQNMFGGTSTEKFKGSQYPKYELPYVAKSYLTQSKQLEVVRVLGLSGYNAGPAWAITAERGDKKMVVAVIRSRGYYKAYEKYEATPDNCECGLAAHDKLHYMVGELPQVAECKYATHYNASALTINPYVALDPQGNECTEYYYDGAASSFRVSSTNYGRFTLKGFVGTEDNEENRFFYSVSLNPADNNYILKVLGTNPHDGDAPIYVESLYDVALIQGIEANEINYLTDGLTFYDGFKTADFATVPPVIGFIEKEEGALRRTDLGKRFLYTEATNVVTTAHRYTLDEEGNLVWNEDDIANNGTPLVEGQIYTVRSMIDDKGKRHYYYAYMEESDSLIDGSTLTVEGENKINLDLISGNTQGNHIKNNSVLVKNNADGLYYRLSDEDKKVSPVTCDLNDYKTPYKYASTPWFVSNLKGDYDNIEMNKLFRFHTISDGANSNKEIKVSIKNILPDSGQFDVEVRHINDTDMAPVVLEAFSKCTLVPGDKNYIAYKIGSFDGMYESKSKYITVEVNETTPTKNSVPCGFLGYPLAHYEGTPIYDAPKMVTTVSGDATNASVTDAVSSEYIAPVIKYNCTYDVDIKNRKQYFGLSNLVGVDVDMFTYKGNSAYIDAPQMYSNGFHLDSRANSNSYTTGHEINVYVDGESGYTFDCVSVNNVTETLQEFPIIATEGEMEGTIFQNVNLRKFTCYFYGGFDGWDEYRDERTTADEYKYSKYNGQYNDKTGEGFAFAKIDNPSSLGLNQKGITSDWYAYLMGIRQFANPEKVDINVFATPGIDYVNNKTLVEEAIEMIEEERADSIYVITTPDKPKGAFDYADEMFTPEEAVANLEDSEIDSNYACTYYPWVKYHDNVNNQYIYLPPTKDVVRNMAMTDNVAYPWFAPAGLERGDVECVKAHVFTKLADEDTLYEGRINPVKTFSQDGVKIWGQKNLQIEETQLNRIAVRRLLLRMRKLVAIACLNLIFEPNDATTKDKFLSLVTPILDNIRANRGISDYKIEVDDSIEARSRYELPAKIFFKPYHALEYVVLDFILTPEGVSFSDI